METLNASTVKFLKTEYQYVFPKSSEYLTLTDDDDRIKFTLDYLLTYKSISETILWRKKDNILSVMAEDQGYNKMSEKKFTEAYLKFIRSLLYAENNSKELARAYGNRSIAFLEMRFFDDALIDLDRALAMSLCPDSLKAHLYIRRTQCILSKNGTMCAKYNAAATAARKWSKVLVKKEEEKVKQILTAQRPNSYIYNIPKVIFDGSKLFPVITQNNQKIIGASIAIELKYTTELGVHFVATRKIKAGEALMVNRAYASISGDNFMDKPNKSIDKFCWNCSLEVISFIPCHQCVSVVYCNEQCRDEAWLEHHEMECEVISAMMAVGMRHKQLMALRLTTKALKEASGSIEKLNEIIQQINTNEGKFKLLLLISLIN